MDGAHEKAFLRPNTPVRLPLPTRYACFGWKPGLVDWKYRRIEAAQVQAENASCFRVSAQSRLDLGNRHGRTQ